MSGTSPATVFANARIATPTSCARRTVAMQDGQFIDAASVEPAAFQIDLRDHVVSPGFVNAHDHLPLNCIPPLPHPKPFGNSYEWIAEFERYRRTPAVAAAVDIPIATRYLHGALKNILAGVTTVAHHDPRHIVMDDAGFPVDVPRSLHWCHSLGLGGDPPKYGPNVRESFLATPPHEPWVIHLAEGVDELARAELSRLDALGCLAPNTVLVHGVGITVRDIDRVIDRGAAVVWCPSSNFEMLHAQLQPQRLFAAGRLALGTDSRLTGSRDLLVELLIAADQSDLQPVELFELVTTRARTVLRLPPAMIGEPKSAGDCLIVRERDDPYQSLVATARAELRAVVRDGVPVVADPDFADWFAHCGVDAVPVRLDGHPKLLARHLARTDLAALEPGLEIC